MFAMGKYEENVFPGCLSLSHFYNIDHRKSNLVCLCRSTSQLFTTDSVPNIQQLYYLDILQHPDITLILKHY